MTLPNLHPTPCRISGLSGSEHPFLTVVVVNYRQWEETFRLAEHLMPLDCVRQGQVEMVIVDNRSPSSRLVRRLRRYSQITLRRGNKNHGFARAVNEACRVGRGEWFLLLNPDTTLSDGFLDNLLQLTRQLNQNQPSVGIVGFHLRNSDGSQQLSTGPFPTLSGTLLGLACSRPGRKYQSLRTEGLCSVPWVTGCCVLLRRRCWEDLGGFDEDYFLYYEDVDLCRRASQGGWSVCYEPNLAVVHHHPLHSRPVPAVLRLVTRHSLMIYAAKHWPNWQFRLLGTIICLEARLRRLGSWWRGDNHHAGLYRELAHITRDLLQGNTALARRRLDEVVQKRDLRVGV